MVACSATQNKQAVEPNPEQQQRMFKLELRRQNKPLVVTTVAPLTNIVSNIAGDRVDGIIPKVQTPML